MKIYWFLLVLIASVLMVIAIIINQANEIKTGSGININTGSGSDNRKAVMNAAKIKTF